MDLSSHLKTMLWGFPRGPVVKNQPCNARDVDSIPDQRTMIPHATEQLSPHALEPTDPECRQLRPDTAK